MSSSSEYTKAHMGFYTDKLALKCAVLAPMAGFTDAPFRKLCREAGSAWAVTEMVSAKGLVQGDLRGVEIGEPYAGEPDLVIQVFGGEPDIVAAGGRILYEKYAPAALDLNMGCPVKKVTGKSCGSKLMLDPERSAEIIAALKKSVPVPVSAKLRLGYDEVNVLEVAAALAEAGADVLAIHGRTAAQKYTGVADWESIYKVAESVNVPIIGSGDVQTREQFAAHSARGLGVMVARGAMGRPWLFAELRGEAAPNAEEKARTAYRHALLHLDWYGATAAEAMPEKEAWAMRSLRAQLIAYFGFLDARTEVVKISSLRDLRAFIEAKLGIDVSDERVAGFRRMGDSFFVVRESD